MTRKLRAELNRIEKFLMGDEGRDLADVLAGLRGPDNDSWTLKDRTTVHIRKAAFPKLAVRAAKSSQDKKNSAVHNWVMNPETPFSLQPIDERTNSHFANHVRHAALVLNLTEKKA